MTFVDGMALKQALIRDAGGLAAINLEVLPECYGCGRTHTYVIGARDLSLMIGANKEARARLIEQKQLVASKLQAMQRGRRGRLVARARKAAVLAYKKLIFYAACTVQRMYRGWLDRRRYEVEQSLLLIKNAHPMLVGMALQHKFGERRVFWYKRSAEIDMLNRDYKLLVRRTGYQPPLHKVEWNINEIARRIFELQCAYATIIQKHFRGVVGRNFIRMYRREVARIKAMQAAAGLLVQRNYRGWSSRMAAEEKRVAGVKQSLMKSYLKGRRDKKAAVVLKEKKQLLAARYKQVRKEELSARVTGKVAFGASDGHKMRAYMESPYGDNRLDRMSAMFISDQRRDARQHLVDIEQGRTRGRFLEEKKRTHPSYQNYYVKEMVERSRAAFKEIESKSRWEIVQNAKLGTTSRRTSFLVLCNTEEMLAAKQAAQGNR